MALGASSYITVAVSARNGLMADDVVVEFHETSKDAAEDLEAAADRKQGGRPEWFLKLRKDLQDPPDPKHEDVKAWRAHVASVEKLLKPVTAGWANRAKTPTILTLLKFVVGFCNGTDEDGAGALSFDLPPVVSDSGHPIIGQ